MKIKDKSFGQRLKWLREQRKIIQTDAAQYIGVGYSSLQIHELGQWPSQNNLLKYIEFYKCNRNWLLTGEGQPYDVPLERLGEYTGKKWAADVWQERQDQLQRVNPDEFTPIPMAEARLNAGAGAVVISEEFKEFYQFRKDWIQKIAGSARNLVLMRIYGESMFPTLKDGDTVMVDQARKHVKSGCIYALGIGDAIMIKRLDLLADQRIQVISDNRAEYPPYEIQAPDLRIIGQVIWFARELVRLE